MKNWYVAKIKPHKERFLTDYLASKGIETYFPKILRITRRGRVVEPLFPTYIFCKCDPVSPEWPMIRWAPGLSYFLGSDCGPTPVPESLMDYLHVRVEWWNEDGIKPTLRTGERIKVIGGPLDGLEGIFQAYVPARQRCRVLLHTVSRLMTAEVPEAQLQAVASDRLRLTTVPSPS